MGNTRENRFTVHQRLAASEARLNTLEAENKQLRQWVLGELTSKINDAKNVIQDSIRVPQDGRDGKDSIVPGPKGERGEVLYVDAATVKAAADALRAEKVRLRAKYQAAIFQAIVDAEQHSTSSYHRIFKLRLENLKREFNLE
jgi:hypothetical protein